MLRAEPRRRTHQVKVSLCRIDAAEIASAARDEGVGCGTYVRRITLRHLAALRTTGPTERDGLPAAVTRDRDAGTFGFHISVLFSADEYAHLQRLTGVGELTVSGYLGRCVVERWLLARRRQRGPSAIETQLTGLRKGPAS
jgi:hypothetical protein